MTTTKRMTFGSMFAFVTVGISSVTADKCNEATMFK